MITSGGLAGRRIVITRPSAQCPPLFEALRAAGSDPIVFPLLDIQPIDDPGPIQRAAEKLGHYALAIFISPNAVNHAVPYLLAHRPWPSSTRPAGIGPGTAKALAAFGIPDCLLPETRFDSEGLLAQPALHEAAVNGRAIALFRGNGGRELLADTLRARGATVDAMTCYQRTGTLGDLAALLAAPIDALLISSSEALRHLMTGANPEQRARLAACPFFVPHERIAETGEALGLRHLIITPPADEGLLQALRAYNWSA